MNSRKAVIVAVALFVGALHFLIGPDYRGPAYVFIHSYLIDILLPMAMYLIAGLIEQPLIGSPAARAVGVFGVGVTVEILQYFEYDVFGSTFDPLDYLMYAAGILLGYLFELCVLSRLPKTRGVR